MNRRNFLKVLGVGAGAALVGGDLLPALAEQGWPDVLAEPAAAEAVDPVWRALNRVTFGPRPGQAEAVTKMGLKAYLEQQLNPESINDAASEKRLGDYVTLDMTAAELAGFGQQPQTVILELKFATVMRAIYSERQLLEVMIGFWSDHFSIWHNKEQCKFLKTIDDREVIRKYALGKFRDLLGASAKSPAMLIYLDNAKSDKKHPNENYARELLELHTMGVGSYTEKDVLEIARCLTGWALDGRSGRGLGAFLFRPGIHDNNEKEVQGVKIPAKGGIKDGETVLDILAKHPKTAQFIAHKLCRRFIADQPPQSAVKAVADTFLKSDGDIKAMLRTLFELPEFLNAAPKFKRPFEYLMSIYRGFDATVEPTQGLNLRGLNARGGNTPLALLQSMEHLPFDHETPEGYGDVAQRWQGNVLLRWNAAINTLQGVAPGVKIDLNGVVKNQGIKDITARSVIAYFAKHLLGRSLTQPEFDAIWKVTAKSSEPDLTTEAGRYQARNAIALIVASPAFQYR